MKWGVVSIVAVAVAILAYVSVTYSLVVKEFDERMLYVMMPVRNTTLLRDYLSPDIQPDTYNGTVYVQQIVYHMRKLETFIPHIGFVPTGQTGYICKTALLVKDKDGGKPGYLILSMDFGHTISGGLQAFGCSLSQKGALCHEAHAFTEDFNTGTGEFTSKIRSGDGHTLQMDFDVSVTNKVDFAWSKWVINRQWKYLQQGHGSGAKVTIGPQQGKNTTADWTAVRAAKVSYAASLLASRFDWAAGIEEGACEAMACFYTADSVFVDGKVPN